MGRRWRWGLATGSLVTVLGLVAYGFAGRGSRPRYVTAALDRGEIADVVGATGILEAVTTVQVGSQVSGTIATLGADFNSVVEKDQVVARLDPSLFEARLAQAEANLAAARANVDRSSAAVDDSKQKYDRSLALARDDLFPQSDLESAKANWQAAVAQERANRAAVKQAEAAVNQARVDLEHTVIVAPISGVVLARNVDVGQTVAASLQAPTLFVIANDLTRMRVNASIDEADIGRIRVGQAVEFRVDAYPDEVFRGRVEQVRLQAVSTQNVVTYNTIIGVSNDKQRLMPGMTATVSVVVERREDALRLPSAALRFRPEGFEARPSGGGNAGGPSGQAWQARQGTPGQEQAPGHRRGSASPAEGHERGRAGLVFVVKDGKAQPVRIRLGISDGRFVEVLDGLEEGAEVITAADEPQSATARPGNSPSTNPFSPSRPQPRAR